MAQILVIDDDAVYRILLKQLLEEAGYDVTVVDSGEAGIAHFRAHRPDVVITDLIMQGMTGADVVQALRDEFQGVQIVGISGGVKGFSQVRRIRGVNKMLSKPIDPDALFDAVKSLLPTGS